MGVLILTKSDVESLVSLDDCIDAVEGAFRAHALGHSLLPAPLGLHVPGGGFHVKAAQLRTATRSYFAAKLNANFPANPTTNGLPTIQGLAVLSDAVTGEPLAVMDSIALTVLRTGAATAVAARHLALPGPADVAIAGCGEQGRVSIRALARVRPLRRIRLWDIDPARATALKAELDTELTCPCEVVADFASAARVSTVVVTCTPSHSPLLGPDVGPGTFIAAVGADNPEKHEIAPALMARAVVVADITDQCAAIGDLHHAIVAGLMTRADVRAELGEVIAGTKPGRFSDQDTVVFDSTGTALQDVAVAALAFERAVARGLGQRVVFASAPRRQVE